MMERFVGDVKSAPNFSTQKGTLAKIVAFSSVSNFGAKRRNSQSMMKSKKTIFLVTVGIFVAPAAMSQTAPQPPVAQAFDGNGVNQATGLFDLPGLEVGIGADGSGLKRVMVGSGLDYMPADNFSDSIRISSKAQSSTGGSVYADVSYDGQTHHFYVGGYSNYPQNQDFFNIPSQEAGGTARLRCSDAYLRSTTGTCTLVLQDGTKVIYDRSLAQPDPAVLGTGNATKFVAYGTTVTRPDGEVITLSYTTASGQAPTLISATSSLGWMLKFHSASYQVYDQINAVNLSATYCDPAALTCAIPSNYPSVSASANGSTTTLYRNGTLEKTYTLTGYLNRNLEEGSATISSPLGVSKSVTKGAATLAGLPSNYQSWPVTVTKAGRSWQYSYSQSTGGGTGGVGSSLSYTMLTGEIKNPDNSVRSLDTGRGGKIKRITDELSRTTYYIYANEDAENTPADLIQVTPPEGTATGGYSSYNYDSSGRVRTETRKAKAGSGLADLVTTVEYATACDGTNDNVCNKPTYVVDANGKQTDFTYFSAHGGIWTKTDPADSSGVRPQTRYSYTALYPKTLNSTGDLVPSAAPVYRLTQTSTCRVATSADPASCVGTANETVKEYEYNTNNLLLTKETVRAGNANTSQPYSATNVWQSTSYTYDVVGNRLSVDGPRTDIDDKSYTTYDVLRRPVYEIGPDPDGAGALPRKIVHHLYDGDGREYRTETGIGNAIDGSDFAWKSYSLTTYDSVTGLPVKTIVAQQ